MVGPLNESRIEPVDQEVTNQELIARQVPKEQRLPNLTVDAGLRQFDEGTITTIGVKAAIQHLTDISSPVGTRRTKAVVVSDPTEVLQSRQGEVPVGECQVGFVDQRPFDDRER